MDTKDLVVTIRVPVLEGEIEDLTEDLQYELGMLFTGQTSFNREAEIVIEVQDARRTG